MAKLYYTKDVKKLIEDKISKTTTDLINDETLDEQTALDTIRQMRLFKEFGLELIADMEELDRKDDEWYAKYRAEQAKEETTDEQST